MDIRRIKLETFLFMIAFLLALVLRFYQLGAAPLSDSESVWALQSYLIANPDLQTSGFGIGPNPAYVFSTGFLFTIFGASNFLARFWPALAGSILVLAPVLIRRNIGIQAALISAFGLAIDPGLVAVSRTAGGPILALAFGLIALGLFFLRHIKSSGIMTGLASLSGPSIFTGVTVGLATWITEAFLRQRNMSADNINLEKNDRSKTLISRLTSMQLKENEKGNLPWRELFLFSGGIILTAGTYFFLYPQGLAAWFDSFLTFLKGWFTPSGIPAFHILVVLTAFQPIALLFGLITVIRWFKNSNVDKEPSRLVFTAISSWFLASLLFLMLYPAREVSGLIWALVPLWVLASWEISRYLRFQSTSPITLIFASIIFILCVLFWNALISSGQMLVFFGEPAIGVQVALIAGVFLIAALSVILVSLGWNRLIAERGLLWGISAALLIYTISLTWNVSIGKQNQPQALWYPNPGTGQALLLMDTLQDISNSQTGMPFEIPILSTVQTPSMRWFLRDFRNTQFLSILPSENLPDIVITREVDNLPPGDKTYRGQDFVWNTHPGWNGALPPDYLSWLTFHKAPSTPEMVILWASSSLFPDNLQDSNDNNLDSIPIK
jgi:hypothetical protein